MTLYRPGPAPPPALSPHRGKTRPPLAERPARPADEVSRGAALAARTRCV